MSLITANESLWTSPSGSPSSNSSVCSTNWSPAESLKENLEPETTTLATLGVASETSGCVEETKPTTSSCSSEDLSSSSSSNSEACSNNSSARAEKKMTVIAKHRRQGEESLSKLKEEVRKYALDHTFKETAKKFGIHHSTVSGWVKARERQSCNNISTGFCNISGSAAGSNDSLSESDRADEAFIRWLKRNRETESAITLARVKDKVAELFSTYGTSTVEKTCKWFLLWNNR